MHAKQMMVYGKTAKEKNKTIARSLYRPIRLSPFKHLGQLPLVSAVGLLERGRCGAAARALLGLERERELEDFVGLLFFTVIMLVLFSGFESGCTYGSFHAM